MKTKLVEFIGRIQDGGAETLVKDYSLLLDKDLFDITILCEDYVESSSVYRTLIDNGVKIVAMYEPIFFINKVLARILGKKYVAFLFKKSIKKINPDIIHCHLEVLEILYYAKNSLENIKLLFTCHNPPQMLIGNDRPKERDACKYLIENNHLQIIALHEDMANEINNMFEINNTKVVKNAINFERFRNIKKSKDSLREELNIPNNAFVLGQIGRFSYQKNQEFTIELFNELLKYNDNSYLLLIGRGKQEQQLRKRIDELGISEKIRILKNRSDVPELLSVMDVFIFPSRYEGLGIVFIEAQVSELPCVISDNIPSEAILSPNVTVLSLNEPKETWIDAIRNPVGNVANYNDINTYDMNKEIKNLEKIYLE